MVKSTHINEAGLVHMVDVSAKRDSKRIAVAQAKVRLPAPPEGSPERSQGSSERSPSSASGEWYSPKGPVFQTAVLAGIQAAKQCSSLIPLCHALPLDSCEIDIRWDSPSDIYIRTEVVCTAKTGAEMEALTAASVAALTIYDMAKSVVQGIEITDIRLLKKQGGKSDYAYRR